MQDMLLLEREGRKKKGTKDVKKGAKGGSKGGGKDGGKKPGTASKGGKKADGKGAKGGDKGGEKGDKRGSDSAEAQTAPKKKRKDLTVRLRGRGGEGEQSEHWERKRMQCMGGKMLMASLRVWACCFAHSPAVALSRCSTRHVNREGCIASSPAVPPPYLACPPIAAGGAEHGVHLC